MSEARANPEHQQKQKVTAWLEMHGATVWWEERNEWGHPTFHIDRSGTRVKEKPDMVVEIDDRHFAAEFKPKESKSAVYNALLQLQGYWFSHCVHDQKYVCGGDAVDLDWFLTATGNSIVGHLFDGEYEDLLTKEDFGESRVDAIHRGELPHREYNMTEQHVRQLWRTAKKAAEGDSFTWDVGVGSLLSTTLDGEIDPRPAVLWCKNGSHGWRTFR